jgi:site-specific DNA recombinase
MESRVVNAIIYARVSTEEQGRGYSLPTQIAAAEKRAAERGYLIVGTFTDEHTGTELERPGLTALFKTIADTRATIVLAHDIDRIGREVVVQAVIEREIENAGARIEYVQGDYQNTPEGDLLKAVKGGIAAYENRQRVERSRRGKDGRARAGSVIIPAGRAPYGYTYVSTPHRGELVINERQSEVVRQIFSWLTVSRLSSYEISRRLHEAGVPSKADLSPTLAKKNGYGDWAPTSIRGLLSNPVYKGVWYWGKKRTEKRGARVVKVSQPPEQWIAVSVPAIVDDATWEQAQECLMQNKAGARRNAKRDYLLRGRIFCTCGRRWTGRYKNHLGRAYYRCPTTEYLAWRESCPTRFSYRQERIDQAVWGYVVGELLNPENLMAELERQRVMSVKDDAERAERLLNIGKRLRDIDRKLSILLEEALDGLPPDIILRKKNELLARRGDLEESRQRAISEMDSVDLGEETAETLLSLAQMVKDAEPRLTFDERCGMLKVLRVRLDVVDASHARVSGLLSGSLVDITSRVAVSGRRRRELA